RVELVEGQQCDVLRVAQALDRQLVAAVDDHEDAGAGGELTQPGQRGLGRRRVAAHERLHDVEPTVAGPIGEGATQRGGLHLLGGAAVVRTRRRAVDDATAGVLRRTDRALAGAAGALLAVRLLAAASDLATRLDVVRALTGGGELGGDDLV